MTAALPPETADYPHGRDPPNAIRFHVTAGHRQAGATGEPQTDRRLGIREFSMADRNICAQIMRLCVATVACQEIVAQLALGRPIVFSTARASSTGMDACVCG
jgi:hypothetical protein